MILTLNYLRSLKDEIGYGIEAIGHDGIAPLLKAV
jgi:hypothetical protein